MNSIFGKIFPKKKKALSIYEEEKVQSPFRTMMKSFIRKKLTIIGITVFSVILLTSLLAPFFVPNDRDFTDSTQVNIRPGFFFMKAPKDFVKNAADIGTGNNYAVGVDKNGKTYIWGDLKVGLKEMPENMGKITQVSAGYSHALALNDQGEVFTWGSDEFGLQEIPEGVKNNRIVYISAGRQISIAVDEENAVYVWGNQNIVNIRTRDIAGKDIVKIQTNFTTGLALLGDGSVVCLTVRDVPISRIPEDISGQVKDIAVCNMSAAALTNDGRVVVWGSSEHGVLNVPENIQGRVTAIESGLAHYTALLDDGTVQSWGYNKFNQADNPSLSGIESIHVGYYQNYAVDKNGTVYSWGLKGYLMGSDQYGRDVFTRLVAGGKISMTIGAVATIISAVLGIILGSISGYYGGKVDMFMMRFAEVWSAIPFLPTAIILSYLLANSVSETGRVLILMGIQGVLNWPGMARMCRAQMLQAREYEFVTAAKSIGIKTSKVIFRHIFPNIISIIAVRLALSLAGSMLNEASLSFLGLGIKEPTPTWGSMLNSCIDSVVIRTYWWRWVFPAVTLGFSVLSLNIIGDGLREAFDPKSAER